MNNLSKLNDVLFEQLDRLNDTELESDKLYEEITRAEAIGKTADKIINNAELVLKAHKYKDDYMNADLVLPRLLDGES